MVVLKKTKDGHYVVVKDREINSKVNDNEREKYGENLKKNIANERNLAKLSTKSGGISPDSPESTVTPPGETGDSGYVPPVSVDNFAFSQSRDTEKNRISATHLYRDVIKSKDGRRVTIDVYDAGEEEIVKLDKVIRRRKLKFVIQYKNIVKECIDDCSKTVSEIARAMNYSISKGNVLAKIEELREEYKEEEVSIIEYAKEKYAEKIAEIEKDPFAWILNRTKEIVGYERLKLLTFLSLVSTRLERVMGISRVHILLVGPSGAGKSSTIKSILKLAEDVTIKSTRITQNALGYLNIPSFDGYVLFIEQIDGQTMNYLRELMTEEKICTLVAEKDIETEEIKTRQVCIEGQPTVISTSVVDTIDVNREQLFNRFIKVYVKPDVNAEHIWETILERTKVEIPIEDMLIFRAWLLSRPSHAEISEDVKAKVINFMKVLSEYTREPLNRTVEIIRNLIIAVAVTRGKAKADIDDFEFVIRHFQLDILYNGLGLSERDVEFIEALPDDGSLRSQEIADRLRVSKQYAINVLKNLERKGVIEGDKIDGKTYSWWLTQLGRQIKALVNNINDDVVVMKDEKEITGIADRFFHDDNVGRRTTKDTMHTNDDRGVQNDDREINEFMAYIKQNNGVIKEFFEIVQDFDDKDKANRFIKFCVSNGYCQQLNMTDFKFTYNDNADNNDNEENLLLDVYKDLKGKQYAIKDFYSVLGDDLADKILKWAEQYGFVNRKIVDNEEYIEFL
uniref:Uncharacterized protein n=1 Tax=Saccharolobus solfataricus (strain ATCC 35092 / DSM 1617 / JCM 11322 / P2) TaxID=273057 RepID=A5GXX7_SACS2|nr:MarR family transcriptional regulator [Saccharolobus solfataricus]ABA64555.1 hypothetical protein [Saccharolobus solfataricus P2]